MTYQLLDQDSCQSPIGGSWAADSCSFGGTFLLPETGALVIPSGTTLHDHGFGRLHQQRRHHQLGTITNGGTISNAYLLVGGEPSGGSLLDAGTITNSATLTNAAQLTVESGGSFTNYAQLNNDKFQFGGIDGGGLLTVNSGGTFTNSAGATMDDQENSEVACNGSCTNAGIVTVGDFADFDNEGTVINSGTFTSDSGIMAGRRPLHQHWDGHDQHYPGRAGGVERGRRRLVLQLGHAQSAGCRRGLH